MRKTYIASVWLVILAVIGLINWYATPTMSDDVMYRFIWQQEWQYPFERIESLSDVVKSQIIHYQYVNGRTITHSAAQIMLNLVPENIGKIVNTAMFLLLIWSITILVAKDKKQRPDIAILSFGMIFLLISGFSSAFIWMPFTYLWALNMTMLFLIILKKKGNSSITWKTIPLIPLSFITGWSHEAVAVPVSVALGYYLLFNHKRLLVRINTYCIIAYIAGAMMIVTSPSLWNRADIEGISLFQRLFYGAINLMTNTRISWLLLLTLVFSKNIKDYTYAIVAWVAALAIVIVCGTTVERVAICADFIAMLICLSIWQGKVRRYILFGTVILCVCTAIPAILFSQQNYQNYLYHRSQLQKPENSIIKVRQLDTDSNWLTKIIAKRYVFPTIEFGFYSCYMAFDEQDSNNMAVAQLYHKKSVVMLPEDVINKIENDSNAYKHYEADEHNNLFIQQITNDSKISSVVFKLHDEVPINFYQRLLTYHGDEYKLDPFNFQQVEIGNRQYIVMTIPPSNIRRRIKSISLVPAYAQ